MIAEPYLKVDRINLPSEVTRIAMEMISEESDVELALPQGLGVVDRKKPGASGDRRRRIPGIFSRARGLRLGNDSNEQEREYQTERSSRKTHISLLDWVIFVFNIESPYGELRGVNLIHLHIYKSSRTNLSIQHCAGLTK